VKQRKTLHSPDLTSTCGQKDGYTKLKTLGVGPRLNIKKSENVFAKILKSDIETVVIQSKVTFY
jgi:hypothetical protein